MDFELDNMEIIDSKQDQALPPTSHSLLFEELQKDLEEYQQKLKLSHRRILLYEGENQKLIEEKNKLFFEMKDLQEKLSLFSEKNQELEKENLVFSEENLFLKEKTETLQKVNETQLSDIKRFSKFHLKIQNVVKPYIENLKERLSSTLDELAQVKNHNDFIETAYTNLEKKLNTTQDSYQSQITSLQLNKTELVRSYEEQIHSFSKEIIGNQQREEELNLEILRLKKSVEYKNFYENEVIKFKRIHEEDQKRLNDLQAELEKVKIHAAHLHETNNQLTRDGHRLSHNLTEKEHILESTRQQLSRQLEQEAILSERLARLEKLNLHLSQQMRPISEEPQKES